MENNNNVVIRIAILGMATFCMAICCFNVAEAADPPPLQDFCIATDDASSAVFMNGRVCKNPKNVRATDFMYKGFNKPGNTSSNPQNAIATLLDVEKFPALNTQGVAIARVDFGPLGLNTLHWHPRGSEVFTVMKGTLYAGFVTSDNKLFWRIMKEGDVIVFPQALLHFQWNFMKEPAFAIAAFGTQNPGRVDLPNSAFATGPPIVNDILMTAFQVDHHVILDLKEQFPHRLYSSEHEDSLYEMIADAYAKAYGEAEPVPFPAAADKMTT